MEYTKNNVNRGYVSLICAKLTDTATLCCFFFDSVERSTYGLDRMAALILTANNLQRKSMKNVRIPYQKTLIDQESIVALSVSFHI